MVTSLYLSNNNILAVQGSGGKRLNIKKVCRTQIPEGSLINGIITNETELAEELRRFWEENHLPKKISLVISSSQFTLKTLSFPNTSDKKIREMIPMEFENSDQLTDPIYDYMTIAGGNSKMISLQAVMAERGFVKGYVDLFASIGITVESINTGRACLSKFLHALKQLEDETCVVMNVDNSSIGTALWTKNSMLHSTQNRVFSEPGTEQFGAEIARIVSNILQFASTQRLDQKIGVAYLSGVTDEEFELYSQSVEALGSGVKLARMDMEPLVKIGKNVTDDYRDYIYCFGNMAAASRDINLVERAKKKTKKRTAPVQWKKYVVWPLILLILCGGIFGFLTVRNRQKTNELNEIEEYLNDPSNIETNAAAKELETKLSRIAAQLNQVQSVGENIDSYPKMNSSVVTQLENYAGNNNVSLAVTSYDASEGTLAVDAEAADVTQINHFVDSLEGSGLFDDITYTGYTIDDDTQLYTIHVTCYLAEDAGK